MVVLVLAKVPGRPLCLDPGSFEEFLAFKKMRTRTATRGSSSDGGGTYAPESSLEEKME